MIYLETILLTILTCESIASSITDVKSGVVYNKSLLFAAIAGAAADIVYYCLFAREYFAFFAVNFCAVAVISIVFYAYHIWAAGDSKLFILTVMLIPARIYSENRLGVVPAMSILIYTFSIAFVYVIAESIVLDIKQRSLPNLKFNIRGELFTFLKQYIYCAVYMIAFYQIMRFILPNAYSQNAPLLFLINIVFVLTLINYNLFKPVLFLVGAAVIALSCLFQGSGGFTVPDLKSFVLMIALILIRKITQRHNYKELPTQEVKAGMVLSFVTVATFINSRTKELPQSTTEDISSRISAVEAESIRCWGKSKAGKPTIIVVRKIPFAIFISIGTLIFVLSGVCK